LALQFSKILDFLYNIYPFFSHLVCNIRFSEVRLLVSLPMPNLKNHSKWTNFCILGLELSFFLIESMVHFLFLVFLVTMVCHILRLQAEDPGSVYV
jgi:hypothetical protein